MKTLFFLFGVLCLFVGCQKKGRGASWMEENGNLKILCTTAQIGDVVKEIGGERFDIAVLIQGDLDPHSYELVKGDGEKIFRADFVFYNGLGLEHGASLSELLKTHPKALSLGDAVALTRSQDILKQGPVEDPHLWMDLSLWKEGVDPIVGALSQLDPEGAEQYVEKGELLKEKMELLDQEILSLLQSVDSKKRYLVTSHDAFHYFTRRYLKDPQEVSWRERFRAPEGLAPDGQLSPLDLEEIVQYLHKYRVAVIFPETNVSQDAIRKIVSISQEMGLDVAICRTPLYGDAMSGQNYFDAMRKNAQTIQEHLK